MVFKFWKKKQLPMLILSSAKESSLTENETDLNINIDEHK